MSTEKEFDPFTASLDELKQRANAGEGAQPVTEEQPRNPDGTFAARQAADPQPDPEPQVENEAPLLYEERTIDLGDGSGQQKFRGFGTTREEALQELADKLVQAQENATKKIKQQQAELSKTRSPHKERSADEEFQLAQEIVSQPSKAIEKVLQDVVGMPLDEFKSTAEAVKAFNAQRSAQMAADQFVAATPDYNDVPGNAKKISAYLKTFGLAPTVENYSRAYQDLSADGMLVKKEATPPTEPVRPAVPVKRAASGLSTRGSSAPVVRREPTFEDIERETANMTLAQIRAKANAQSKPVNDIYDF